MGWLGWTAPVALATDVNLVRMALDGRIDVLALMGLVSRKKDGASGPMGKRDWGAFKTRHNMRYELAKRNREREGSEC